LEYSGFGVIVAIEKRGGSAGSTITEPTRFATGVAPVVADSCMALEVADNKDSKVSMED
jgi:hypothetical protein